MLSELTGKIPAASALHWPVSGGLDSVGLLRMLPVPATLLPSPMAISPFKALGPTPTNALSIPWRSNPAFRFSAAAFPTRDHARARQISIQMAARDLRGMNKLETVRREQGFDWLVTAHHWNDSPETFSSTCSRVAGCAGWWAFPRDDRILRPLNGFTRRAGGFSRKRASFTGKTPPTPKPTTSRNQIRHLLVPVLRRIQPGFEKQLDRTFHASAAR
ncbi:MAG: hypothetical protein IPN20_05055 [Haliscomenobacter sp.]|nr:hypothetical protein [Haliscomenobacter sp.]